MKTWFTTILFILISTISSFAQVSFEKGYYIDNTGAKIGGLIKNRDWRNNPSQFEFKYSENDNVQEISIDSAREFGIYEGAKFIRSTVDIDISTQRVITLSEGREPIFENRKVFLKVLVEGQSSLYMFVNSSLVLYFFSKPNSIIEQLIYKRYLVGLFNMGENTTFRKQILDNLICSDFNFVELQNVEYTKEDLEAIMIQYNICVGADYRIYNKKKKRDLFNLTVRPRLNRSSSATPRPIFENRNLDFENRLGIGFGIEAEMVLPINKNKWSVIVEPAYQSFKDRKVIPSDNISGGMVLVNLDYSSIELSLGGRHYLFLNENAKFFITMAYTYDFTLKSLAEFTRADGSVLNSVEFRTHGNYSAGLGFKYLDRYGIELRYVTLNSRTILFSNSKFDSMSIILGYTLF